MKKLGFVFIAMLFAFNANAADDSKAAIDAKKIYFGGGVGLNSLSGIDFSDGIGFQFFAGYELPVKIGEGTLSVEAGYMDSGNMEKGINIPGPTPGTFNAEVKTKGLWGNAVVSLPLQDKLNIIGRLGLDIGDDDGIMLGGGLGFQMDKKMEVRAEYVIRDNVDSLQVNSVIRQ